MLNHIDLFSGIGGFALAAQWAGFKTVVFCEIEPFCQEVLKKHWPNIPMHPDIRTFHWTGEGPTLVTGGFPCQPFSCAGKRRGKEDDRWLWPEMLRVISEARPTWVLGENVAGIVNMELEQVCADLEAEGYEVQPLIIPACAVNAPHRRDRVWIIAYAKNSNGRAATYTDNSWWGTPKIRRPDSHAPDAECIQQARRTGGGASRISGGKREQEKMESNSWSIPWPEVATRLCRVDDGVPRRVDRLKALGNAIAPQVAYEIIKEIARIETGEIS